MSHRVLFAVLIVAGASCLPACTTNPATGKSYFMRMSREQEAKLGEDAAPGFTQQYGGVVADAELRAYVDRVGMSMVSHTEAYFPELNWEFNFVDSEVVNAFALPGGKVFITRGLAERLDDESQMAGVLGHEIGHVTAQHANRRISSQTWFNVGVVIAAVAVGVADSDSDLREYGRIAVPAVAIGGNLVYLSYGRNDELEADELGMRYMSRAGYNPRGQRGVMEVLAEVSGDPDPGLGQLFATHPYPEDRIEEIDELLATEYAGADTSPNLHTYEDRFRIEFLTRLSNLPPARHRMPAPQAFAPATPVMWCRHCAAGVRLQ